MKPLVLLLLVLVFAGGVVVGERRATRVHNEQVQALQAQIQSWQAHHLGVPTASLMTTP
jgi:hypothetical protein